MELFALGGHGLASALYALLAILLLTAWHKPDSNHWLPLAAGLSALWAGLLAIQALQRGIGLQWLWAAEALRPGGWLLFMISLLMPLGAAGPRFRKVLLGLGGAVLALVLALLISLIDPIGQWLGQWPAAQWRLIGQLLLAVIGLILVEQLFRNSPLEKRWTIKYLCLGLGTLFAYDFYLYADALLFQQVDGEIWAARGAVNALVVPLVGISVARNPTLKFDLFLSRSMVFHSTALLGAGLYMLAMALAGYYIRLWGGEWGAVLQIMFLVGALVMLAAMLFSGQLRARAKVFFNKHFFRYRYDYRDEWLRVIGTLTGQQSNRPLPERVIWVTGEIVESPGGLLWTADEHQRFQCVAVSGHPQLGFPDITQDDPVIRFMQHRHWIINLAEFERDPERYSGLEIPAWLQQIQHPWLLVPLLHDERLEGFVVLLEPRSPQSLNYENLDLLKTVGMQAASYLAFSRAAEALAEARQFEGFNRLSAFVLHDLKNLIAQLSLVARNAKRHKHNPEFMEDAVKTIDNAVAKMNRLMVQLKTADGVTEQGSCVNLTEVLSSVVGGRQERRPAPSLELPDTDVMVVAEGDRLGAVIGHVIQNAEDATPPDGQVAVSLRVEGDRAIVDVRDTGSGMDKAFIEQRLFRPFDSTKGLTGMGIGAYECREFVRAMGGSVEVESEPGKGTLFRMVMPLIAQ